MVNRLFRVVRSEPRRSAPVAVIAAGLVLAFAVLGGAGQARGLAAPHASAAARTPWPGGTWQPDPATYGVGGSTGVPIRLGDSTTLIADVYYPTNPQTGQRAAGRFPVLLAQDPYLCQTSQGAAEVLGGSNGLDYFVQRGYDYVIACARGTGRSGGSFDLLDPRLGQDGVQLVDWSARDLVGSDGIVGGIGCSYSGIAQLMTAAAIGPHSPLKAIAPMGVSSEELYGEGFFAGGMPSTFSAALPAVLAEMGPRAEAWGTAAIASISGGGTLAYDGRYWQRRAPGNFVASADRNGIPALMWLGWNDLVTTGGPSLYAEYQNAADHRPVDAPMTPGQPTTGDDQIVIGPWNHCEGIDPSLELEWYDTWLKGDRTGIAATPTPMHLYDSGTGDWTNAADWPLTKRYTPLYLHSGGQLTGARLAAGGSSLIGWAQPDPAAPDTVLNFTSAPLSNGATIAGPISATFYASSSGTNLQLIAELDEVAPDGTVTKITTGSLVASLRALDHARTWHDRDGVDIRPQQTFQADQYLTPGKPVRLDFTLSPRDMTVEPGDSLRLVITTQTPAAGCALTPQQFENEANELPCVPTAPQAATLPGSYRIYYGPAMASAINLPLLPAGALSSAGTGPAPLNWG